MTILACIFMHPKVHAVRSNLSCACECRATRLPMSQLQSTRPSRSARLRTLACMPSTTTAWTSPSSSPPWMSTFWASCGTSTGSTPSPPPLLSTPGTSPLARSLTSVSFCSYLQQPSPLPLCCDHALAELHTVARVRFCLQQPCVMLASESERQRERGIQRRKVVISAALTHIPSTLAHDCSRSWVKVCTTLPPASRMPP